MAVGYGHHVEEVDWFEVLVQIVCLLSTQEGGRVEAAEQSCVEGTCCPRTFFRCISTEETSDPSESSAEDSCCVAPNKTSVHVGEFSFLVEHDKMEDESIPSAANFMPSNNIFIGVNLHEEEKQAIKEHMQVGMTNMDYIISNVLYLLDF